MTTQTANTPRTFRKAITIANQVSLRAGELYNSLTDGETVTFADVRELGTMLVKANSKRKSLVDASTAAYFFDAARCFGEAADAILTGDTGTAAARLDEGANSLDLIEQHVQGLFA